MTEFSKLNVAIPHYWFVSWRGGEKVVRALLDIFPAADIYTLFYDKNICSEYLNGHNVYTSALDLSFFRSRHQKVFPLYPFAVKSLKLRRKYDLILSSESGPIKGIANPDGTPHICYVHTPMRYCWGFAEDYLQSLPGALRGVAQFEFERLRKYDVTTIENVDSYVANSRNVQGRIKKYYSRDSEVIYPPISLDLFSEELLATSDFYKNEFYLSFGAITPYKRIDLLVDVFAKNGKNLVIIGDGSERRSLEARAPKNILFTGSLKYSEITKYILRSKALIFAGEEDFGMIPLEVMAHGIPVIALSKGGALETVVMNESNYGESTGIFFDEKNAESLSSAIDLFERVAPNFNPHFIRSHARSFGEDFFKKRITDKIKRFIS